MEKDKNFLTLCFHYVKSEKTEKSILGNSYKDFIECVDYYAERACMMDIGNIEIGTKSEKTGILYTFDDGLQSHYECAKYLYQKGIKGIFFIPTCILEDNVPANPMIIHYGLAKYRIDQFLHIYEEVLKQQEIDYKKYLIRYDKTIDNVWEKIDEIKEKINYSFDWKTTRKILLSIYHNYLVKDFPNIMTEIHLTVEQLQNMKEMGHYIGVHTHSHVAINNPIRQLGEEIYKEIVYPKTIIKKELDIDTKFFSYPYGVISSRLYDVYKHYLENYSYAFTLDFSPRDNESKNYLLKRVAPSSKDNLVKFIEKNL